MQRKVKIQSPSGDVLTVDERAFEIIYRPLYNYQIYTELNIESEQEPEVKIARKSRKVKKVEEE